MAEESVISAEGESLSPVAENKRPSTSNSELKDMVMQMQNQMQIIMQKMKHGETLEQNQAQPEEFSPSSKTSMHEGDVIDLDYEEEIQELLNAASSPQPQPDVKVVEESCSEEVSILHSLASDLQYDSKTGCNIAEPLAKLVNNMCSHKLPQTKIKEKLDKYQKPGNVDSLQVTQVNQLVWDNLHASTKSKDLSLQKIQNNNIKAMVALTTLLNEIICGKSSQDKQNLMSKITDALVLMGANNIAVNTLRRDLIRPEIKQEFKAICSKAEPSSSYLFGNDVSQQIRDIANANRLSKRCITHTGGKTRGPYRQSNPTFRGSTRPYRGAGRGNWRYQPFLGKRQLPYNRQVRKEPSKPEKQ